MSTIVVFVEHTEGSPRRGSLEAIGAARAAGADCVAVLSGPGADAVAATLGTNGAARAVVLAGRDAYSPDATAAACADVVKECGANGFLAASSACGRDLAPRVAAHLDCTLLTDCIELSAEGDGFAIKRPWLAGKCIAAVTTSGDVLCATTRLNVFQPAEGGGSAEVQTVTLGEGKAEVVSVDAKSSGALDVKEAPVVISGGRGLKEPEHFKLIEELAAAFGNAAVGASRAVVDAGWRPHSEQVGQTGKTVSPQLYVAIGISGAIQHLAGMRTSGTIVAINKDADAPIFKVADYGIVGDASEVVPALTEEIAKIKAQG
ncbi:MAG: electron transfer flavoprotein subunit alpha/FixB family protein [bacterium]|nr:electron transfer flavoprotein subunit alpha/FixB family protein [bacterium]